MRKAYAYLLGGSLIISSLFVSQSCTKHTDPNADLIGNWTSSSDFDGYARGEAVTFTIGTDAYIATGYSARDYFKDLWVFNLDKKYWSQKADMPTVGRYSAVAFTINGKGYVGTGFDGVNYMKDFWEYDPAADTWTQKDDFAGTARYDAFAFGIGNNGYVSSGTDGNYLKDLYQFDPNAATGSQWIQKSSIGGSKRTGANVFVMNNIAYVVSGNNNGAVLKDMWSYDPSSDTWTQKRPIYNYSDETYDDDYGTTTSSYIARQNGVTFIMGAYAYLTTGTSGSLSTTTWRYDPSQDQWLQKTAFEGAAREGALAFSLSDRGFVITGKSGSLVFDNAFEFHPDDAKVDGD
ncbi:MAG: kelch repeat-containing protein [Chitinophagaceae bacterium]